MHFTPAPDTGLPYYALIFGLGLTCVMFVVAWLVEALLLRRTLPGAHAFRDSFAMNLITTVVGVPLVVIVSVSRLPFWAILLVDWLLTIALEAALLRLLERGFAFRQTLRASAIVNTASYAMLILVWLLLTLLAA
jgi:hypothetical protein